MITSHCPRQLLHSTIRTTAPPDPAARLRLPVPRTRKLASHGLIRTHTHSPNQRCWSPLPTHALAVLMLAPTRYVPVRIRCFQRPRARVAMLPIPPAAHLIALTVRYRLCCRRRSRPHWVRTATANQGTGGDQAQRCRRTGCQWLTSGRGCPRIERSLHGRAGRRKR